MEGGCFPRVRTARKLVNRIVGRCFAAGAVGAERDPLLEAALVRLVHARRRRRCRPRLGHSSCRQPDEHQRIQHNFLSLA